jgi:hypothetical protein
MRLRFPRPCEASDILRRAHKRLAQCSHRSRPTRANARGLHATLREKVCWMGRGMRALSPYRQWRPATLPLRTCEGGGRCTYRGSCTHTTLDRPRFPAQTCHVLHAGDHALLRPAHAAGFLTLADRAERNAMTRLTRRQHPWCGPCLVVAALTLAVVADRAHALCSPGEVKSCIVNSQPGTQTCGDNGFYGPCTPIVPPAPPVPTAPRVNSRGANGLQCR